MREGIHSARFVRSGQYVPPTVSRTHKLELLMFALGVSRLASFALVGVPLFLFSQQPILATQSCGSCAASLSQLVAGTNGSGTIVIQIEVTGMRNGTCITQDSGDPNVPPPCRQNSPCRLSFKIYTPGGSNSVTISSIEVDPGVDRDDTNADDWTTDSPQNTGTYGYLSNQQKTASCGKQTFVNAQLTNQTPPTGVAMATLTCAACD